MLWNYKTFHFSPKMRQMMYPDCKTTLKGALTYLFNFFFLFQTSGDFAITRKLILFSKPMANLTAEKCFVWKIF